MGKGIDVLMPTNVPRRGGPLATAPMARRPVAWWKLTIGLALGIALISLLQVVHGMAAVLILAGGFAMLGICGWLWGYDSRDGADWKNIRRP